MKKRNTNVTGESDTKPQNTRVVRPVVWGLLIVGIAGTSLYAFNHKSDAPQTGQSAPSAGVSVPSGSTDSPPEAGSYDDACSWLTESELIPDSTLEATPFVTRSRVTLAVTNAGPCSLEPFPTTYAHSPTGALSAAVNYSLLLASGGTDIADVLEALLVPGADADAMIERAQASPAPRYAGSSVNGFLIQPISKNEYEIGVALGLPDRWASIELWNRLVWTDNDWKIVPVRQGSDIDMRDANAKIPNGFTAWDLRLGQ